MKRLLILALIAFAGWYGWHHYRDLLHHMPSHEAVIENHSGRGMTHVRLTVDGQTFVRDQIASDASAAIPFHVDHDASFQLVWMWENDTMEKTWSGGLVPKGPMVQRHHLTIDDDGGVLYRAEQKLAAR
jgi:hypothetical protein